LLYIYKYDINILSVVLIKAFKIIVDKKNRLGCIARVNIEYIELSSVIYTQAFIYRFQAIEKAISGLFCRLKQEEKSFSCPFSTPNLTHACQRGQEFSGLV